MTKQELMERFDRHAKLARRWRIIWMGLLLTVIALTVLLQVIAPRETRTIVAAASLVLIYATVFGLLLGTRRTARQAGLVCPHCHASFTGAFGPLAVASGRCGKCGKQIVDEGV